MELFFELVILVVLLPSHLCLNNLTYVFSHTTNDSINSLLRFNHVTLLNSSFVQRLSSTPDDLVTSTRIFFSSTSTRSIVFSWNSGDCSYPSSVAKTMPNQLVSSPMCFTGTSSLSNLLQLTVTSQQLAQAAGSFMTRFSLHYFSMILTDSNIFYSNFARQFSGSLTETSFIYERLISTTSFSPTTISSLKSRSKSRTDTSIISYEEEISS
jgi:hypothetical protein